MKESCKIKNRNKSNETGFSLIETLISMSVLLVVLGAYVSVRSKTTVSVNVTEVQQNLTALRHFVNENFSCEETIKKNLVYRRTNGIVTSQFCPPTNSVYRSIKAYNIDGNPFIGHKSGVRFGNFKVRATCTPQPTARSGVSVPQFRFLAQALDPKGLPLKDPFDPSKTMKELDIFDGLTIPCTLPNEPLSPRPGDSCSISMIINGGVTNTIIGRDLNDRSSKVNFELRAAYDAGDPTNFGKPYSWEFYFINKKPKDSQKKSGVLKSTPFTLRSNAIETMVSPKLPECVPIASDPVSVAAADTNPNCKFWKDTFNLSKFQAPKKWYNTSVDLVAKALTSSKKVISECVLSMTVKEPLILSWQPISKPYVSMPQTLADFDMEGVGEKKRMGWIYGDNNAYLTLDLSGNGIIDNGLELFSEFTLLPDGSRAKNGYEALSQYDSNQDGFIDREDPIFEKLKLWFDLNGNAQTDPTELISLQAVDVRQISLNYQSIPESAELGDALARYAHEGVFYGGQRCRDGCRTFEVYFGLEPSHD